MARLGLSFLGTFHVTLDQQPVSHFRSNNIRGLLVYLTLHGERPVAREVLAALFWPDDRGENAHNNLRQAIYQLRQLLGDTASDAPFLTVTRQALQFNCASDHTLDVSRFVQAIEAHDLDAAVGHYAGELLPGFTCDSLEFEEWLGLEREHLHQLALEAMFEAAQDHLAAGRLDKAQAHARRQLALEAWREPAHRQLMQVFALAGDRAKALAQYEVCRVILGEQLGVEPSPETRALRDEIAAGRYGRALTEELIRPPERKRHNLPADTMPFIGRETELAAITHLLTHGRQRLVTIVAPGGMGKTRLALAVGASLLEQYDDGVYFVDLASVERAEDVLPAIATVLNYQAPDRSVDLKPQLLASLGRRQLLLILDNFEQVLGGAALVNELLRACAQLSLLVTSRQRLHLAAESRYELGGLDFPGVLTVAAAQEYTAVRLFVASGRRARPDFTLTADNVADVARICRQAQGMPLALILAAAWLELLTPGEIAAEIEHGLEFLSADLADLPARQRSMVAVFDRSWRIMTPEEQTVMARLSIFRGGFTREAAEGVAGANLRILLALVNKSLLQRHLDTGRFTIHELLRQYAAARRRAIDPGEEVELAHCRAFARLTGEILIGETYVPFVPPRLAADMDNIHRAWRYALTHALVDEVVYLIRALTVDNCSQGVNPTIAYQEAQQALQQRVLPETHPMMLTLQQQELGTLWGWENTTVIKDRYRKFLPIAQEHGEARTLFWAYIGLGGVHMPEEGAEALACVQKAAQVALESGNELHYRLAEAFEISNRAELGLGNEMAATRIPELMDYLVRNDPFHSMNYDLYWALSDHYLSLRAYDQAIACGLRGLNMSKSWRHLYYIGHSTGKLADIYLQLDETAEAARHLLDDIDWHLAIGQTWQTLGALWSLLAHFATLFGGGPVVVPTLAMVYHHSDVTPFYRQLITSVLPRFKAEMGAESFAAAWEQGKTWDFDSAVNQVRSTLEGLVT